MTDTKPDKFAAVWVSFSSISDFLKCPRLYYYNNLYKNPKTGRKISIMAAPLALGQVVHSVLESLSLLPADERFASSLTPKLEEAWQGVEGKKGGFKTVQEEEEYKNRGIEMLETVTDNPGPLENKAVKIKGELPFFWLSEEENIILCGKLDWIEFNEETGGVHIIDFKTSKRKAMESTLQLPIYYLLATECQNRPVERMSYWYLALEDAPESVEMPDGDESRKEILKIAKRMKLARQLNHFKCSTDEKNGCRHCAPYDAVIKGQGEFVGVGTYNKEVYILSDAAASL